MMAEELAAIQATSHKEFIEALAIDLFGESLASIRVGDSARPDSLAAIYTSPDARREAAAVMPRWVVR